MSSDTVIKVDFKRIRTHAVQRRIYPTEIAKAAGITRQTVHNLFSGTHEPSATTLKAICDAIDLPIEQAFTQEKAAA